MRRPIVPAWYWTVLAILSGIYALQLHGEECSLADDLLGGVCLTRHGVLLMNIAGVTCIVSIALALRAKALIGGKGGLP